MTTSRSDRVPTPHRDDDGVRPHVVREPVHLIEIGRNESIKLSVYGVLLSFLALAAGASIIGSDDTGVGTPWLLLVAGIATILLHELVHGAFFKLFGGSPTFGAGITHFMPYAYATSDGDRFSTRQMNTIAAAPLFVVTAAAIALGLAVPESAPYAVLAIVINVGGAIGDLWMMREMARFRHLDGVTYEDRRDGVGVHTDDPRAAAISSTIQARSTSNASFGVHFIGAAIAFGFLSLVAALVLATIGSDQAVRIGPSWFALIDYAPIADGGFELGLNFLPAIVAGLLFATAARFAR